MEEKTLKELMEQLKLLNENLAASMSNIQNTIPSAKEEEQPLLRKIFGKTTKRVLSAEATFEDLTNRLEENKKVLRQQTEEILKIGIQTESEADMSIVVQTACSACEQNIEAAKNSLQQLRLALQQSVQSAEKEIVEAPKDNKFAKFFQDKMQTLEKGAKVITAQAYSFTADAARRSSDIMAKAHKGLMSFGSTMHEASRRLHNVWHALKGETFETEKFQPKGILKKMTDYLAKECTEMNKEAREYQDKSTKLNREVYGYTAEDYRDRDHELMDDYLDAKAVENFMSTVMDAKLTEEEFRDFLLGKNLEPEKNLIAIQMENKMKKLGIRKEDVVNGVGQKVAANEYTPNIDLSLVTEEDKAIAEIVTTLGDAGLSYSDYITYLTNGIENMIVQKHGDLGDIPYDKLSELSKKYATTLRKVADICEENNLHPKDVERAYNRETGVPRKYYQDIAVAMAVTKTAAQILT